MILRIELWDWECFEHCVVDDVHRGLNLIFGESDSGKTSIVRALKLASYNEFDPRSVRTGAKNCRVRVETERGWVDVKRGADNIWETCRRGETPAVFSKIGKNVLPEAAEILGLHIVELGDMRLPVNIMDQGEGHFMLNELGGDSASGSMRAQIVDEISGLSGIEGLIKGVSLDRHRFGRVMKDKEDRAIELRSTMHDPEVLRKEGELLEGVSELLDRHDDCEERIDLLARLFENHHSANEEISRTELELGSMPNTKVLQAILGKAEAAIVRGASMSPVWSSHQEAARQVSEAEETLAEMPDEASAAELLDKAGEALSVARAAESLVSPHRLACEEIDRMTRQLAEMPDVAAVGVAIEDCERALARARTARLRGDELGDALSEMDGAQDALADCEDDLAEAVLERNEALAGVDVCPLTDRPVSKECFKGIKFPVTEVKR
jgi:DNA repair exonuclease SbcCD ATPase subunit